LVAIVATLDAGVDAGCEYTGTVTLLPVPSHPVFVALERVRGSPSFTSSRVTTTVTVRDGGFDPPIMPVEVSTGVNFRNGDGALHHIFSASPNNPFDASTSQRSLLARTSFFGPGIVHLQCAIHPSERGELVITQTPFFTQAGPTGQWSLRAPAGAWKVTATEPNGGRSETTVSGCGPVDPFTLVALPPPLLRQQNGSPL
jgi:plastocyanin